MSTARPKKVARNELLEKLWTLGRTMSTQTVFLHQAIAQTVGLNATDTKCVDLVLRGPPKGVTAGWLSEMTGLTTGAITHIVDRLEKRGFTTRVRDTDDRRKVLVRARMEGLAPLLPRYEAVGDAYIDLLRQYTDAQLELICGYLEQTAGVSERLMQKIIAERGQAEPEKRRRK